VTIFLVHHFHVYSSKAAFSSLSLHTGGRLATIPCKMSPISQQLSTVMSAYGAIHTWSGSDDHCRDMANNAFSRSPFHIP